MRLEWPILRNCKDDSGKPAELDDCEDVLSLGLHMQRVFVSACNDVDRSGKQRLERLPAALEIAYRYRQAVVLEVASPLRQRQRQIIEVRLVGDTKPERGPFNLFARRQRAKTSRKTSGRPTRP